MRRLTIEHYYSVDAPHFTEGGKIVFSAMTNNQGDEMSLYVFDESAVPQMRGLESHVVDRHGNFGSSQPDVCTTNNETVFVSNRVSRPAPYDYELWLIHSGDTRTIQLTHEHSLIQYPVFDRFCGRIFFMSDVDRKGTYDLCVCQADGSNTRKLYPTLFQGLNR
jgi:hypothetical protein